MIYTKLVSEVSKMYDAFRNDFGMDESLEFTKICLREFPIFREMIEEKKEDEPVYQDFIGYILFNDGTVEQVYAVAYVDAFTYDYYTKHHRYRVHQWLYDGSMGPETRNTYIRYDLVTGVKEVVDNIKDIDLVKEGLK